MSAELERVLRSLGDQRVVYIPNLGNAGDSLIAHATYQLFSRVRLNYEIGNYSSLYPDRVVIYGGGGALVKPYPWVASFLKRNLGKWRQLIILPHTIRDFPELLAELGSNSVVFCRELRSHEFVKQCAPNSNVMLEPDLAFTWDINETSRLISSRGLSERLNSKLFIRKAKRVIRGAEYQVRNARNPKTLSCIRKDAERTQLTVTIPNIDLSEAFIADDMLPASSLHTTYDLMRFIERFELVRTNRLHVAIMAAMLDKHVEFHDNSYGKNRDIFEFSIQGRFPKVVWKDA